MEKRKKETAEIWTAEETAQFLRLNLRTIYRLVKTGKLPGRKIGRQWRFKSEEIEELFGMVFEDQDA